MSLAVSTRIQVALVALTLVMLSFALTPHKAHAAALTIVAATTTSNNASTTLAKVGNTFSFGLQLSGTPVATSTPVINIQGMGTTSMTGSGAFWSYSTTTASAWNSGAVQFYFAYGDSAPGIGATTTKSQADLTGSNVTFDKTAPTGYTVDIASTLGSADVAAASFTFSGAEVGASYLYYIGTGLATTTGSGTISSASQQVTGIDLSSYADGATLSLNVSLADPAGNRGATTTDSTVIDLTAPSAPVADPVAGSFTKSLSVTLTSSGSSAIRYTTDGSAPTCSTGTVYGGAITVAGSVTIKAIGCDSVSNASAVSSFEYSRRSSGGGGSTRRTTPVVAALTTPATQNNNAPAGSNSVFTRDLEVGMSGDDVKSLQAWLNAHGFMVAASGPGSKGMETMTFGSLTKAALAKFQAANGIPAIGRFGPMTRASVSSK